LTSFIINSSKLSEEN
jgi:hypothetical protein